MSKRDYEAIAEAIARAVGSADLLGAVIFELCDVMQRDNPRFDRARFSAYIMEKLRDTHTLPVRGTVYKSNG